MYCSKCGTLVADDAGFCFKCGAPVVTSAPETGTEVFPTASAPSAAPPAAPSALKPRSILQSTWAYLVGVLLIGVSTSDLIPALQGGHFAPMSYGWGSLLLLGAFFAIWWKRRGRRVWVGFAIGAGVGVLFLLLAMVVAGVTGAQGAR